MASPQESHSVLFFAEDGRDAGPSVRVPSEKVWFVKPPQLLRGLQSGLPVAQAAFQTSQHADDPGPRIQAIRDNRPQNLSSLFPSLRVAQRIRVQADLSHRRPGGIEASLTPGDREIREAYGCLAMTVNP